MLIKAYNPSWVQDFKKIKDELNKVLNGLSYTIEHIGSTAVPELPAKPIIDIDVVFYSPTTFGSVKKQLEQAGYYHNGNQGIEGREVFKRKEIHGNSVLDTITHHLYVCPQDSVAFEAHLLFRDHLRNNSTDRKAYANMKLQIATEAQQQKKHYAMLKTVQLTNFIDSIVKREKAQRYK